MKLGKYINGNFKTKEAEGEAIDVAMTDGYKPVCECEAPSADSVCTYTDGGKCYIQEWSTNTTSTDVSDEQVINELKEVING